MSPKENPLKIFTLMVLATLGVCVEAGLSISSPGCTLKDKTQSMPYAPKDCPKQTSSFMMDYKGRQQVISGKILNLPACNADGEPKGRCYSATEALFGIIPYGKKISGALFYNFLGDVTACTPINPLFNIAEDDKHPITKILLVERGGCSFVRKVRMAQNAGAAAVIVMNNNYISKKTVYMGNDGSGNEIKIPSVFVDYETGIALKVALKTWGDNTVRAALSWTIPQTKGKVRWSFWTSAEDLVSKQFKENFRLALEKVGVQHQTFTPHLIIIDGSKSCFRSGPDKKLINICGSACIYEGMYCATSKSPEGKIKGEDIVMENFRQLCMFNVTAGKYRDAATSMWWHYNSLFSEKCDTYSADCSENQMAEAGYTQSDIKNVRDCTGWDGGRSKYDYTRTDGLRVNFILEKEIKQQKDDNVFTIPSILINDFPYRGGFKCPRLSDMNSADSCPVVNAMCTAFADSAKPSACKADFNWDATTTTTTTIITTPRGSLFGNGGDDSPVVVHGRSLRGADADTTSVS